MSVNSGFITWALNRDKPEACFSGLQASIACSYHTETYSTPVIEDNSMKAVSI